MLLRWHSDTPDIVSEHYGLGWYLIKSISEEDWDSWPPPAPAPAVAIAVTPAAAAAFSLSAFKERIFPHNDGGNNIAAAAAAVELTSHRIEPRPPPLHCTAPHRGTSPPQPSSNGEGNRLLLSDDRGCPLAQPTQRVRRADSNQNLQGELHVIPRKIRKVFDYSDLLLAFIKKN